MESDNNFAFLENPISKKLFKFKFTYVLRNSYWRNANFDFSYLLSIIRHAFFDVFNLLSNKEPAAIKSEIE